MNAWLLPLQQEISSVRSEKETLRKENEMLRQRRLQLLKQRSQLLQQKNKNNEPINIEIGGLVCRDFGNKVSYDTKPGVTDTSTGIVLVNNIVEVARTNGGKTSQAGTFYKRTRRSGTRVRLGEVKFKGKLPVIQPRISQPKETDD